MKSIFFSTGGVHLVTMLGMLTELQNRIDAPDVVGGISAGAMMAAICSTYGISDAIDVMMSHMPDKLLENRRKYFNTILSFIFNNSLLKVEHLLETSRLLLQDKVLQNDLYIGYTNSETMEYVTQRFEKGKVYPDLYKHVVASMSIPMILPPVEIEGIKYVDGGMYHSLPVEAIQQTVQESIKQKDPLDLVILMSKPWKYKIHHKANHSKFFPMLIYGVHFIKGYQCITVHNDQTILESLLQNAKLEGDHVNYSLFHLKQSDTEEWDTKIPMENYGNIKKQELQALITLGKSIINENLKTDLKF